MDYATCHGRQGKTPSLANTTRSKAPSKVASPLPLPPKQQLAPEDPLPERPSDRPPSIKKWRHSVPIPIW